MSGPTTWWFRVEIEATIRECLYFEARARREIAAIRELRRKGVTDDLARPDRLG